MNQFLIEYLALLSLVSLTRLNLSKIVSNYLILITGSSSKIGQYSNVTGTNHTVLTWKTTKSEKHNKAKIYDYDLFTDHNNNLIYKNRHPPRDCKIKNNISKKCVIRIVKYTPYMQLLVQQFSQRKGKLSPNHFLIRTDPFQSGKGCEGGLSEKLSCVNNRF